MSKKSPKDPERKRLAKPAWKKWGPYLADRQWGTVREDYSSSGDAWNYLTHDKARSKAYRWGEEGIGGFSDDQQFLCFAWAFWNHQDPILKERYFGLTGQESNHGEDVKEIYYYLDATPTHSYQKMLYKYPQQAFPYEKLIQNSRKRGKKEPEYELVETGIFDENRYFDLWMEYAKASEEDILIQLTVHNQGPDAAPLTVLPTLWFRNTWCGAKEKRPALRADAPGRVEASHPELGTYHWYLEGAEQLLFCENETNQQRLYQVPNESTSCKDGINDYIISGADSLNQADTGTKAAGLFSLTIPPGERRTLRLRLSKKALNEAFADFDVLFAQRQAEADAFYEVLQAHTQNEDERAIQRQAFAGMLWTKQFYYYDVNRWLQGDPGQPAPPASRKKGRNATWPYFHTADIMSMPDGWEFPWFAAWDLAFQAVVLARLDPAFAKYQLEILLRACAMHPNGQIPAYEWHFSDANPPVHAWAALKVYAVEKKNGKGDLDFLERVFQKLLLNFTWWVNRKDTTGSNLFEGGFLGLDNIGVFDRSELPANVRLEQADATSWMAMYCLNMLRIACELSLEKPHYQEFARKFFEHFLYIAGAMRDINNTGINLWDEEDEFYYDKIHFPNGDNLRLRVRSLVGLIPLAAVAVLDPVMLEKLPYFKQHIEKFIQERPDLAELISRWHVPGKGEYRLLSLLRGHRTHMLLKRMLDQDEFLSEHGIRALSKYHRDHPYEIELNGTTYDVHYIPGESDDSLYGGNSNWRGPIWLPVNYLLIDSLLKFQQYYGDEFRVEYPTGSGKSYALREIADALRGRLVSIFRLDENNQRAVWGPYEKFQQDPAFRDYLFFHEYFHGDDGHGLGASHQTGWTALIANLIDGQGMGVL